MFIVEVLTGALWGAAAWQGILGNLAASVIYDASKGGLKIPLPERWRSSSLPANHDLEAAAVESLRQTLQFAADSVAAELGRKRTLAARIFPIGHLTELMGGAPPSPEDRWIDALLKAAWERRKLEKFQSEPLLPPHDVAQLFAEGDSPARIAAARKFHEAVDAWARTHAGAQPPEAWVRTLRDGFRAEQAPERRISLFDVWLLFVRETLKADERPFRAWMMDALAHIREQLPPAEAAAMPADDAAAAQFLNGIGEQLDACLRDQREWMGKQFGVIRRQLDDLLAHSVHLQQRVEELHITVVQQIDRQSEAQERLELLVRAALAEKGGAIPAGEAADAGGREASAQQPSVTKEKAVENVASRLQVHPKTVELALKQYASTSRRQTAPTQKQRQLSQRLEQQFGIKPATTNAPAGSDGADFFKMIVWIVCLKIFLAYKDDIRDWMLPPRPEPKYKLPESLREQQERLFGPGGDETLAQRILRAQTTPSFWDDIRKRSSPTPSGSGKPAQ